jgi:type VI secretion system protein ImpB
MDKGSVAPKERVNIVYKPATGDAKEEVELPLKLMVMGNFTMREDERSIEDRDPINVDKDNFSEVLKAQKLEMKFNVDNKLADEGAGEQPGQLAMDLKFESLKDFEPDQIVKNVPELAKLMELREALSALKGPLGNVPDFRKKIQSLITDEGTRDKLMKELGIEG